MTRERIRLLVLYGGESAEHDVSCVTAAHVVRAIDPAKYAVTAVGIAENGRWSISAEVATALEAGPDAIPPRLDPSGGTPYEPSAALAQTGGTTERVVALPLLHGPLGEDGTVQGLMELADVAYVGTGVLGSALGMDKAMAKRVLASAGIPQARAIAFDEFERSVELEVRIVDELGLPCFVKPANMGSSVGVSKAHSRAELAAAIDLALSYDSWVVAEEAVSGREIEVGVLGNEHPAASVPGEIVPGDEFYSYDDKYVTDGAELLVPAPLSPDEADQVRELALRVFRTLRCQGLARVDFFYEEGGRGFLCNEVNTMPGFTPISMYPKLWAASGVPYPDLIDRLVTLALERHARRRRNTKH
jgi:D-alanine-D-alanine ligase